MSRFKLPLWPKLLLLVVIAAALQGNLTQLIAIKGVQPDLLLVCVVAIGVNSHFEQAAVWGFLVGWLTGSLVGVSLGSFIITRTALAMLLASMEARIFRGNPALWAGCAFLGTLLCESFFYLLSPHTSSLRWLYITLGTAAYNTVLVLPIGWLVSKFTPHQA